MGFLPNLPGVVGFMQPFMPFFINLGYNFEVDRPMNGVNRLSTVFTAQFGSI